MKKLLIVPMGLLSLNAFADYYPCIGYISYRDDWSGFEIFILIASIVFFIISIIVLFRWWSMTSDIKKIRNYLQPGEDDIIAIYCSEGKEAAQKAGIKSLVTELMEIYDSPRYHPDERYNYMAPIFSRYATLFNKLGLVVPPYLKTVSLFIKRLNEITGNDYYTGEK